MSGGEWFLTPQGGEENFFLGGIGETKEKFLLAAKGGQKCVNICKFLSKFSHFCPSLAARGGFVST